MSISTTRALQYEAEVAGDMEMASLCRLALGEGGKKDLKRVRHILAAEIQEAAQAEVDAVLDEVQ